MVSGNHSMSTQHPQVKVNYFGYEEEVDEEIADLLQLIWSCGYKTYNSCQDNNNSKIWIQFSNMYQFQKLVQTAHTYHLKVNGDGWITDTLKDFFENEDMEINIDDDGHLDEEEDEYFSGPNIELLVSIRFPKERKEEFMAGNIWQIKKYFHRKSCENNKVFYLNTIVYLLGIGSRR